MFGLATLDLEKKKLSLALEKLDLTDSFPILLRSKSTVAGVFGT